MNKCRRCGSERIIKTGNRDGVQKWKCKDAGNFMERKTGEKNILKKKKKLKFVDFVVGEGSKEVCKSLLDKLKKYTINMICPDGNYHMTSVFQNSLNTL